MTPSNLARRVVSLERKQGLDQGRVHVVLPDVDETAQAARSRYEADHKIGPQDKVLMIRWVEPDHFHV